MLNPVVVSVALVLVMCLLRVNVVIALTTGALACGLVSGKPFAESISLFSDGLGGGAKIALSYAILGAFASALAHSGVPEFVMGKAAQLLHLHSKRDGGEFAMGGDTSIIVAKFVLFASIELMSIACKNIIPVHIAFIPILIPPLLGVFNGMGIDRRAVACIITFGVIVAYMVVPLGFGEIFLMDILSRYLRMNGLEIAPSTVIRALLFPAASMAIGLFVALVRYGKPRHYGESAVKKTEKDGPLSRRDLLISCLAIAVALLVQIAVKEIVLGALAGFLVLSLGGVVRRKDSENVVANGFKVMSIISFTMLAAAGFGYVLQASGGIDEIVNWVATRALHSKALAAFGMLFIGFLISVGIGSSFSTVPIVASVYVPLGIKLGFSPSAIAVIVAISGVTGDAGSPASDSVLGPTMGLNADGQHSLVGDTAIPTFLHIAIPAFLGGWLASILL
ncbi:MAG: TRAP transporter large permease subunit [Puniceicoccales bacterium]|jgi:predicted histidine transporter YuiF (NhaC family)|nr:TRAP transporter large permease subunit [Puniceicoccales bacterium]